MGDGVGYRWSGLGVRFSGLPGGVPIAPIPNPENRTPTYGTNANTRSGLPDPFSILSGAVISTALVGGS